MPQRPLHLHLGAATKEPRQRHTRARLFPHWIISHFPLSLNQSIHQVIMKVTASATPPSATTASPSPSGCSCQRTRTTARTSSSAPGNRCTGGSPSTSVTSTAWGQPSRTAGNVGSLSWNTCRTFSYEMVCICALVNNMSSSLGMQENAICIIGP